MRPPTYLELVQGETPTWVGQAVDDDGGPVDLTGSTATFTARRLYGGDVIFTLTDVDAITIDAGTDGTYSVKPPADATEDLPTDRTVRLVFELFAYRADDAIVLDRGVLIVHPAAHA